MSGNRSVQAAQRRRTAPSDPQPPGRSNPQPSINSAQLFASQSRGPNIPPGRLAGQQATMQQQQALQQQQQASISNISKMTLAQAITLITLRLGAVESKLLNLDPNGIMSSEGQENMVMVDNDFIISITSRLDDLEKNPSTFNSNSSTPSADLVLLKQQIDLIKQTINQTINQTKISHTSLSKENKELKSQIDNLKKELESTKEVLVLLQSITMENSQKLMNYSLEEMQDIENNDLENDYNDEINDIDQNEIVGTNLKELIESEINANV
jgi:hypothetical protein